MNSSEMEKDKKITGNTSLAEILRCPGAEVVLQKYNVPCLFCPMAAMEAGKLSIGQVATMYSLDLEGLLKELNELPKSAK